MNDSKEHTCTSCGARLPAADASCPACLFELGIESADADDSSVDSAASADPASAGETAPPERIGAYEILRALGEGGMGTVYLAQQREPIRRQVALKVIRRGLDTRKGVARFESERQALAMMDHSAIAKIFDAGETEAGQLYFVMEFIDGEPLHQYCDRLNLPTRERLELFVKVCEGVQHAHRKGVIHRDLKPSNVLVRQEEGAAEPKIIDFGVAKVIEPSLIDGGTITEMDRMIGTPKYMSPEQAELSPLGVDTRSDVYALGVLLYELLTGMHPFESEKLKTASFDEVRRIIREDEPTVPSDRFRQSDERSAGAARHRNVDVAALRRELQGDLDWIALRALEKDPARRYPSPADLAADVRRHLAHEPVEARPPSTLYKLSKFTRRHRIAVAGALGIVLALVAGLIVSTRFAVLESRQRRATENARADLEAVAEFQARLLRDIDLERMGVDMIENLDPENPTNTARGLVDREILARAAASIDEEFADRPAIAATLAGSLAATYQALGMFRKAEPHLDGAIAARTRLFGAADSRTLDLICQRGGLLRMDGRWDESATAYRLCYDGRHALGTSDEETFAAEAYTCGIFGENGRELDASACYEAAIPSARNLLGDDHLLTLKLLDGYCQSLIDRKLSTEAEAPCMEAFEGRKRILGADNPATMTTMARLPSIDANRGDFSTAATMMHKVHAAHSRVLGDDHLHTLLNLTGLAYYTAASGDYDSAIELQKSVVAKMTETLGPEHHSTWNARGWLAKHNFDAGRFDEAAELYEKVSEAFRQMHGDENTDALSTGIQLGRTYAKQGRHSDAERQLRTMLTILERTRPLGGRLVAGAKADLAMSLAALQRNEEAEALLLQAIEMTEASTDPKSIHQRIVGRTVEFYEKSGQADQAAAWKAKTVGQD